MTTSPGTGTQDPSPIPARGPAGTFRSQNVVVPAAALAHLRRALARGMGVPSAVHVLQDAGFATGETLYREFARELAGDNGRQGTPDPSTLPEKGFWDRLDDFFGARGWGHLESERVHSGLGMVRAHQWAEADKRGQEAQPGCFFTSGLLAHLLGQAAGGPVAVLEVRCRSRGDEACEFLYGSEAAVHEIYGLLLDERSVEEALAEL